ncbi:hypothetical protein PAXRUDRAFT_11423 [Paxillus rubicundulus Ve08.2h10]|uniref:Uncharacterized protein n=1 Tax=Paxillus rubicundulus Ve08.2h10 TaxID=930991 RepID=A0A0D0E3K9_9AGAM|nr:hypothetical protein PAXRUDRAFT_11423 [Paxillus rubicundulus Ve08.2h10]
MSGPYFFSRHSRSRFDSSASTWWIGGFNGSFRVLRGLCAWPSGPVLTHFGSRLVSLVGPPLPA